MTNENGLTEPTASAWIPWNPEDELLKRASEWAHTYEGRRGDESVSSKQKEEAGGHLKDIVAVIAMTEKRDLSGIEALVLSEPDEKGAVLVYKKVKSKRSVISAPILLQAGVSADVIARATVESESESWRVERQKLK